MLDSSFLGGGLPLGHVRLLFKIGGGVTEIRQLRQVLDLGGLAVAGPGPVPVTVTAPQPKRLADSPRALRQASEVAGVRIDAEQTFSVFRPGSAIAAAPITAWADQAASELGSGVDFAYAYLASGELDVPPGYYTLRAFADPTEPGLVPARVEIVDHHGEVVAETPAEVEVHSMRVPEQRPFPGTIITTLPGAERLTLWFQCSNGQCIRLLLR